MLSLAVNVTEQPGPPFPCHAKMLRAVSNGEEMTLVTRGWWQVSLNVLGGKGQPRRKLAAIQPALLILQVGKPRTREGRGLVPPSPRQPRADAHDIWVPVLPAKRPVWAEAPWD